MKTRIRRGKVVVIPPEWIHAITTQKTIRNRKRDALVKAKERRTKIRRLVKLEEKLGYMEE
jgi:siroheme synthase (precorrin-2 oxidase/ferrochelatase)